MLKAQICHLVIFFRVVDLNDEAAAQIRAALGDQGCAAAQSSLMSVTMETPGCSLSQAIR